MNIENMKFDENFNIKEKLKAYLKENPVAFGNWLAKLAFGRKLFPYQEKFLADRSKRIIFISGRQCISSDEYVYMRDGVKRVDEVCEGDVQIDGSVVQGIHVFEDYGFDVCFENGINIKVSYDHLFYTQRGWVSAKELSTEDCVYFKSPENFRLNEMSIGLGRARDFGEILSEVGVNGLGKIVLLRKDELIEFLSGYLGCDNLEDIRYIECDSKRLASEFQFILWRLGIVSCIEDCDGIYRVKLIKECPEGWVKVKSKSEIYGRFVGWNALPSREIISYCGMVNHNCGKTTICAIRALWKAWCFDEQTILVVSRTGRQSKVMAKKMKNFIYKCKLLENDKRIFNTEQLEFNNGSTIYFLPGDPDNIRGFSAHTVIIDEAAFIPDELFTAIEPSVMATDGEIIMISSPYKPEGYFYEAVQSGMWSVHRVTCYDNPLISKEEIERFRLAHTMAEFKREMLAEFCEDETEVYVTIDALRNIMYGERHKKPKDGWKYVVGVDVARFGKDYTAIAIVGLPPDEPLTDGRLYLVELLVYKKKSLYNTINRVAEVIEKFNPLCVMIDSVGLGGGVYDVLVEKYPGIIEDAAPYTRGARRVSGYMTLRNFINEEKIVFFKPDNKEMEKLIISHFMNVELGTTKSGQLKVIKKEGGNDDIVDATMYAVMGWFNRGFGAPQYKVMPELDVDKIFRPTPVNNDLPPDGFFSVLKIDKFSRTF